MFQDLSRPHHSTSRKQNGNHEFWEINLNYSIPIASTGWNRHENLVGKRILLGCVPWSKMFRHGVHGFSTLRFFKSRSHLWKMGECQSTSSQPPSLLWLIFCCPKEEPMALFLNTNDRPRRETSYTLERKRNVSVRGTTKGIHRWKGQTAKRWKADSSKDFGRAAKAD